MLMSKRVHASNTENSDQENKDYPLRPSEMKDLRHPAKALYRDELDLDATVVSNEDSEEEDYHTCKGLLKSYGHFLRN